MSANAAQASTSSPRYSTIKGKQVKPGAKDGSSNISVRIAGVSALMPKNGKEYLVRKIITILNTKAKTGRISRSGLISIFNSATKIIAGNAMFRIMVFNPFF